jgi:hypothetical protein
MLLALISERKSYEEERKRRILRSINGGTSDLIILPEVTTPLNTMARLIYNSGERNRKLLPV